MDLVQIRLIFGLILCSAGSKTLILLVAVAVLLQRAEADGVEGAEAISPQEGLPKTIFLPRFESVVLPAYRHGHTYGAPVCFCPREW